MKYWMDFDLFLGGDAEEYYRMIRNTNKDSCMESCLADERCVVFTLNSVGHCFLKAAVKVDY